MNDCLPFVLSLIKLLQRKIQEPIKPEFCGKHLLWPESLCCPATAGLHDFDPPAADRGPKS